MMITGATGALVYTDNLLAAVPVGLLGLLLLVQVSSGFKYLLLLVSVS